MTLRTVVALAVCALALLVLPWIIGNEFYVNMATQVLIYALFALSINMMLGYGGMVSLGHAGYLGIAGYACILAVTAGYDHLTRGDLRDRGVDRGGGVFRAAVAARARPRLHHDHAGARPDRLGHRLSGQRPHRRRQRHPVSRAADAVRFRPPRRTQLSIISRSSSSSSALFCIWRFSRSPFGASLMGARDQPRRMRMLGHNVWLIQWLTFVMAGFWASVAGVLYVYYNLFLSPHAISLQQSAEILLMAILGGASTLTGPIVGAAIITLVKNVISTYVERWNTLLGLIFVIVIMFMPYGLVPGCAQLWRRVRNRGKTPKMPSAALASEASGQRGEAK